MTENQSRVLKLVMAGILLFSMFVVAREGAAYVFSNKVLESETGPAAGEERICIVIDAGHGGADPGKVGINGALEKDVNLEIALMLKKFLEAEDFTVVMTREDENGLYDKQPVSAY